ncbi:MAG: lamin tail domain-containing protein [Bacteroidia bacterium]|nr:lamin tail domain-containing protein [Bacteroidia bacterium]
MRAHLTIILLFICQSKIYAQFTDSFGDGELQNNPTWIYNTSDFEVLNGKLHTTNNVGGNVQFGISSKFDASMVNTFYWQIELGVNPSSANYVDFFLFADTLVEKSKNGYFIRFGNTKDEISFYKLVNGTATEIISGLDGELNKSQNNYMIKVERDTAKKWTLSYRNLSTNNFTIQGAVLDTSIRVSTYTGIKIVQSGTTIIGKHYFDNIWFGNPIPDTVGPKMNQVQFIYPNTVKVSFNEAVTGIAANQFLLNGTQNPVSIFFDTNFAKEVRLTFNSIPKNKTHLLSNLGTKDTFGNVSYLHTIPFSSIYLDTPKYREIIFTEIMYNPTPSAGVLPESEYIEIKNTTDKYFRLGGCKLTDYSSNAILPDSILPPYSYAIITKNTNTGLKLANVKWIGTSVFPSLNNDGDEILFINPKSEKIDQIKYATDWHISKLKAEGGWSLELKDTAFPCLKLGNWGSNNSTGGTPGARNSILSTLNNLPEFKIISSYCLQPNKIRLYFSENPDSFELKPSDFSLFPNDVQVQNISTFDEIKHTIDLELNGNMALQKEYKLVCTNIPSCFGKVITETSLKIGIGDPSIKEGEIVLNEILFNPKGHDADYVELYNKSNRILDLKYVYISNLDDNGNTIKSYPIGAGGYTLFPNEYVVITTAPDIIMNQYPFHNAGSFIAIAEMPTFSNEEGYCGITGQFGLPLDQIKYSDAMHSPFVSNTEGISLERITPLSPKNSQQHWTSAAENKGFGTPGLLNSQYQNLVSSNKFELEKDWFTPDDDGVDDVLILKFNLEKSGYLISAKIFSEAGNLVTTPYSNYGIEQNGTIIWDGSTKNGIIQTGNYILYLTGYHITGETFQKRIAFTVLGN